ncbi:hypothetical protein TNCV_2662271 [Trichonephila clavipes]|nr:hypothetical protein TNCV_2662271 [Trichonephila clavipes]
MNDNQVVQDRDYMEDTASPPNKVPIIYSSVSYFLQLFLGYFHKNIQFIISATMAWLDKISIEQKEVMEEVSNLKLLKITDLLIGFIEIGK